MSNSLFRKMYFGIVIFVILVTTLSVSISYFSSLARGKSQVNAESAKIGLNLDVERITSDKSIGILPTDDSELQTALDGTDFGNCVDDKEKGRCQVYKISVKNIGNVVSTLSSKIDLYATGEKSEFNNLKWAEIATPTDATPFGKIHTMENKEWKSSFVMGPGSMSSMYIIIWISDLGIPQNDLDKGTFGGTVTFESTAGYSTSSVFTG